MLNKILFAGLLTIFIYQAHAQNCELKTDGIYYYEDMIGLSYYLKFNDNDTVWIHTTVNTLATAAQQLLHEDPSIQKAAYRDEGCYVYIEVPYKKKQVFRYDGKLEGDQLQMVLTPPKKVSKERKEMLFQYISTQELPK